MGYIDILFAMLCGTFFLVSPVLIFLQLFPFMEIGIYTHMFVALGVAGLTSILGTYIGSQQEMVHGTRPH